MLLKDERGSALVMVLLVIVVASIMGIAILSIGVNEDVQVSAAEKNLQAYYGARAAADAIAEYIITDYEAAKLMGIFNSATTVEVTENPIDFAGGTATAEVYVINEGGEDRIVIETFSEYYTDFTGHAILILDNKDYFNEYAIWAEESITNSDMIVGVEPDGALKIGSNGDVPDANPNDINIDEDEDDNPPYGEPDDVLDIDPGLSEYYEDPLFPEDADYPYDAPALADPFSQTHNQDEDFPISGPISGPIEFDQLNVRNGTLNIDTSGGDVQIIVSSGEIKTPVVISGENAVQFYVRDEFKFLTGSTIVNLNNAEDPEKFTIFLHEGADFEFRSNGDVYAYIYGPNAVVDIGSSDTVFHGGIIAGSFDADSGANIIYDKPSASYGSGFPPGKRRGEWRD